MSNNELVEGYIEYNNRRANIKGKSNKKESVSGLIMYVTMTLYVVGSLYYIKATGADDAIQRVFVNYWPLIYFSGMFGHIMYFYKVVAKRDDELINEGVSDREKTFYDKIDAMGTSSKVYVLNDMYVGEGYVVQSGDMCYIENMQEEVTTSEVRV